jgi:hypothetical protein
MSFINHYAEHDNALYILSAKQAYPEWMQNVSIEDIKKHIEDEED